MKWILAVAFVTALWVESVLGDAFLSLKFISFSNPGGMGSNGHCCDGRSFFCPSSCDHSFEICLDHTNGPRKNMKSCSYGRHYSEEISNQNSITFNNKIGRLENPVIFRLPSWPGSALLKINIYDVDDNGDDHVDYLERVLYLIPTPAAQTTVLNLNSHVTLTASVVVYCGQNYYGQNCSVLCNPMTDPTGGHYMCERRTGAKLCHPGWTGMDCETNIDDCAPVSCQNGGSCIDLVNGYTCVCAQGYRGRLCGHDVDECVDARPCVHGTCHNQPGNYTCQCEQGYEGKNCDTEIDECSSSPCQNQGVCSDWLANFSCNCVNGFTGRTCEMDIDECMSDPCANGSTCVNTVGSFHCMCSPGFTGTLCKTEIDECESNPCLNGGVCFDQVANYTCQCPSGYTGISCEVNINECDVEPGICQNGGTCIDTPGNFSCNCTEQWQGNVCELNVNECLSSPCLHNSTCVDVEGSFHCECLAGFHGPLCGDDVNECTDQDGICRNQGTCENTFGGFQCICSQGWEGELCDQDVDECANTTMELCVTSDDCFNTTQGMCERNVTCSNTTQEMCSNGGECVNTIGSYTCSCPLAWTGPNCQTDVDECSNAVQPCYNQASCTNIPGSFTCECGEGWTGSFCDIDVDECEADQSLCKPVWTLNTSTEVTGQEAVSNVSHSMCINTQPGYICSCQKGWTGPDCNVDIDECTATEARTSATSSKDVGTIKALSIPLSLSCYLSQPEVDVRLLDLFTSLRCLQGKQVHVESEVSHPLGNGGQELTIVQPSVQVDGQQWTDQMVREALSKSVAAIAKFLQCRVVDRNVPAKFGSSTAESQTSSSGGWFPAVMAVLAVLFVIAVVVAIVTYYKKWWCWNARYRVNSNETKTTFHNNVYTDSIYNRSQTDSPASSTSNIATGNSTFNLQPTKSTTMSPNMDRPYQNENYSLSINNPLYQSLEEDDFVTRTRKESVGVPGQAAAIEEDGDGAPSEGQKNGGPSTQDTAVGKCYWQEPQCQWW